jgi:hypothetical protein
MLIIAGHCLLFTWLYSVFVQSLLSEIEGLEVFASMAVALVDKSEELLLVGV